MDNNEQFSVRASLKTILAGLLIVAIAGWFLPLKMSVSNVNPVGSGTPNIEDYDPYTQQFGLNTAKPVSFSNTFAVSGASTLSGATTLSGAVALTSSFTLGTNGTSLAAIKAGSCTIWAPANTISATSTQQVVCQSATNGTIGTITGITTDAICDLNMASSTNTTIGGLALGGVSASSTAGTIVARLINLTGTTFTWTSAASSSNQWNYACYDPS